MTRQAVIKPKRNKKKQKKQQHDYYMRVTKVKREQARANKVKKVITEPYEYKHVCPVCGKEWTEMTTAIKPQLSKTCSECKRKKIREYEHTEKYREKRRLRAYNKYHNNTDFRERALLKQRKYESKEEVRQRKSERWAESKKVTYMWYNKETNECVMDFETVETAKAFAGEDFNADIHAIVPCQLSFGQNAEVGVYANGTKKTRFNSVIEFLHEELIVDDILEATEETPIRYKYVP